MVAPVEQPRSNPWQPASITRIATQTARVKSFFLRPHRWQPFKAGQYPIVRLTAPDGYQVQRSYSIVSPPDQPELYEIAIDRLDDGEVSPFFHDVAEVEDVIEIRGPLGGHFVWSTTDGGPLLLIGGGSGVAPLMAILRHRAHQQADVPILLIHAARSWNEVIFRDELITRDEVEANLTVVLSLSRDAARRPQDIGRRIDAAFLAEALSRFGQRPGLTFVCGANAFVEAVTGYLLDLGIRPETVRAERYGG